MPRLLLLSFVVVMVAAQICARAYASSSSRASLDIVDARTAKPIGFARIALTGEEYSDILYSDRAGRVKLSDIPGGTYELSIYAPGYQQKRATLTLSDVETTFVTIRLAPVGALPTIATVTATRQPSLGISRVGVSGPSTTSASSLYDAATLLPDVTSRDGLSVDGLSPNATQYRIDGVPLGTGGASAILSQLGLSLFDAVSVDNIGSSTGPGLELTAPDPTIAFSADGVAQVAGLGSTNTSVQARGTIGYVGYVVRHVARDDVGALQGLTYRDASGLTYSHDDQTAGQGTLVKVRVPLSVYQHVLFESSSLDSFGGASCDIASGGTPCGYGPGNGNRSKYEDAVFNYGLNTGRTDIGIGFSQSYATTSNDFSARIVNGAPDPLSGASTFKSSALDTTIAGPLGDNNDLLGEFYDTSQSVGVRQPGFPAAFNGESYLSASLSDALTLAGRTHVRIGVGYAHAQRGHVSITAQGQYTRANDTVSARVAVGANSLPPLQVLPVFGDLSDPESVSYDCRTGRVFANGVGALPGDPTTSGFTFAYKHEHRRLALEISLSAQDVRNAQVPTLATSPSVTPQQLSALRAFYASPGACGTPFTLQANDLVLGSALNADLLQAGSTVSVAWRVTPRLTFAPYVQLTSSRYNAGAGWQPLLFQPNLRSGLLADYHLNDRKTELLSRIGIQGKNNANGIGPYALVDVGVAEQLGRGSLIASVTNVANAYASRFASSDFAAPLPNGIVPIAIPLPGTTFHVSYHIQTGSKAPPKRIDALAALADIAQPSHDSFTFMILPIPSSPPSAPYAPAINASACDPELVGRARAILDTMQRIAAQTSPGAASRDYRLSPSQEQALGTEITVHVRPDFVAFTLNLHYGLAWRAFVGCIPTHFASVKEATARGLYVPRALPSAGQDIVYFDPRVGEYELLTTRKQPHNQPRPGSGAEDIALRAAPVRAPENPFAMKSTCPSSQKAFAQELLHELMQRFARGGNPLAASPYFNIESHAGEKATWWSIRFLDAPAKNVLAACSNVAGVTPSELSAAGVGAKPNALNFASRFGLYESMR